MAHQIRPAQSFKQDLVNIARAEFVAGRLSRRDFLRLSLSAGLAPGIAGLGSLLAGEAHANTKELVIANWGGDAVKLQGAAFGEPYTKDTGTKVIFDGASPLAGKIKAMVESGKVTWDACNTDLFVGEQLGSQGLLEPIDYSVVDKSVLRPGWGQKYAVSPWAYSNVLTYDKTKFPERPPTWADFFDTKKYPGKRTLWKYHMGAAEACLLGDGVPVDKLYPLDMGRAIKKAKSLGKDLILWTAAAESQQMLRDKEVIMGCIWNTRARVLESDTKGRVTWTWHQGMLCPDAFVIPKGNPAGKEIMKFFASTLIPQRQVELLSLMGNGPSNPKASEMAPKELNRLDPCFADNMRLQFLRNEAWYEKNYDAAIDQWIDGLSG